MRLGAFMAVFRLGTGWENDASHEARPWQAFAAAASQIAALSYEPGDRARTPTSMLDLANLFVVLLAVAAAGLGTAALVQKRTVRRRRDEATDANNAS